VGLFGPEQHLGAERDHHDADELEGDLARVGLGVQLARVDAICTALVSSRSSSPLALDDRIAHGAGMVVVLAAGRVDGAAPRQSAPSAAT
jgi:hypothetical protein